MEDAGSIIFVDMHYLNFLLHLWHVFHTNIMVKQEEIERHSVERIPPPGWTVYVLYPTDMPDVDVGLQNRIGLLFSPNELIHKVFLL